MRIKLLSSLLVALGLSTSAVNAADIGIFVRNGTSSVASPSDGKSWILDASDYTMKVWNGSAWQNVSLPKHNLTATTNPSVTDDSDSGYRVGSLWINTSTHQAYILKDATVGAADWNIFTDRISAADIRGKSTAADFMSDFIVSGLIGSVPSSSLTMTTPSGVAYVDGLRISVSSSNYTYTASKDTYDYLQSDGSINHIAVNNSDPAPSGQPGLLLQIVVTDGSEITTVTQAAEDHPQLSVADATDNTHAVSLGQADLRYAPISAYTSSPGNRVWATPDSTSGLPSIRALVNNDLPVVSLAKGGLNNGSITAFNLGLLHGDGSKFVQLAAPTAGLQKLRSNSGNTALEFVTDTNGTVTTVSMTAPSGVFTSPVTVSTASTTPAISLAFRTDLTDNYVLATTGNTVVLRALTNSDLPVADISHGGTNNSSLGVSPLGIYTGDGAKIVQITGTALQQVRINGAGTAFEFFTPSSSGGIPFGGAGVRQCPTSGTISGEYWHTGAWSTTGTITCNRCRLHFDNTVTISHAITVGTEITGGSGSGSAQPFGFDGNGIGAGQAIQGGGAQIGGGGGGHGGAGGNGGSILSGILSPGGSAYGLETILQGSSGGGGGRNSGGTASGGTGGAGGGSLYIEAVGAISVDAAVTANGGAGTAGAGTDNGGGGGGSGGGVDIRSAGTVTITASGSINAVGGAGGNGGSGPTGGGGGGGGGGIVNVKGTTVTNNGSVSVAGGAAGSGSATQAATAGSSGVSDLTSTVYSVRSSN